jgi:hypothetical protein
MGHGEPFTRAHMSIRLACSTLCALAVSAGWWAVPSAHVPAPASIGENVKAIDLNSDGTSRPTFVLPIDVR